MLNVLKTYSWHFNTAYTCRSNYGDVDLALTSRKPNILNESGVSITSRTACNRCRSYVDMLKYQLYYSRIISVRYLSILWNQYSIIWIEIRSGEADSRVRLHFMGIVTAIDYVSSSLTYHVLERCVKAASSIASTGTTGQHALTLMLYALRALADLLEVLRRQMGLASDYNRWGGAGSEFESFVFKQNNG
ncbi:hypothetical protein EVAR_93351_1 [Eumeta japonica]|uniref:Uncharacterized protein n=1 Tax=Eumeta variegata TaxID=151549 RepID=A0A4C1UUS0_EUMVA|nr:hypothetical protein EVAR_93351_1 [Eumeta japonica]